MKVNYEKNIQKRIKISIIFLIIFLILGCSNEYKRLCNEADSQYQLGYNLEAKEIYEEIIKKYPNKPNGYSGHGNVLFLEKNYIESVSSYIKAYDLGDNSLKTRINIINNYIFLNNFESVKDLLERFSDEEIFSEYYDILSFIDKENSGDLSYRDIAFTLLGGMKSKEMLRNYLLENLNVKRNYNEEEIIFFLKNITDEELNTVILNQVKVLYENSLKEKNYYGILSFSKILLEKQILKDDDVLEVVLGIDTKIENHVYIKEYLDFMSELFNEKTELLYEISRIYYEIKEYDFAYNLLKQMEIDEKKKYLFDKIEDKRDELGLNIIDDMDYVDRKAYTSTSYVEIVYKNNLKAYNTIRKVAEFNWDDKTSIIEQIISECEYFTYMYGIQQDGYSQYSYEMHPDIYNIVMKDYIPIEGIDTVDIALNPWRTPTKWANVFFEYTH